MLPFRLLWWKDVGCQFECTKQKIGHWLRLSASKTSVARKSFMSIMWTVSSSSFVDSRKFCLRSFLKSTNDLMSGWRRRTWTLGKSSFPEEAISHSLVLESQHPRNIKCTYFLEEVQHLVHPVRQQLPSMQQTRSSMERQFSKLLYRRK